VVVQAISLDIAPPQPAWALGAFLYSRQAHFSFVMSDRLSASVSCAPTGRISVKLDREGFYDSLSQNPNLVKIRQKYRALYTENEVRFVVSGDTNHRKSARLD
jgi:hypothetical protein